MYRLPYYELAFNASEEAVVKNMYEQSGVESLSALIKMKLFLSSESIV